MKRYGYDVYRYLIFAHKDLDIDYFTRKSGATSGYALELFTRIFNSLMSESMDVSYLYETYYKEEYPTFESFILKYYELEEDIVKEIMDELHAFPEIRLYDYNALSVGENFDDFITSDELESRFDKLLRMEI